ncbi:MAG: MCE family protein [Haliscomenobacter sp.]|nr:MCE family protein [Haliscomenobacter sp.]
MKFLSNEVRVGILAVLALALSFWGYQFIRGKNVLKLANTYYVEYENVSLLKVSTPVTINGVQVGFVSAITPVQEKTFPKAPLQKSGRKGSWAANRLRCSIQRPAAGQTAPRPGILSRARCWVWWGPWSAQAR